MLNWDLITKTFLDLHDYFYEKTYMPVIFILFRTDKFITHEVINRKKAKRIDRYGTKGVEGNRPLHN